MARVLVIAGTASGVGKTSVTVGLLAACRRRGLRTQAFKVGPDFIDPGFHALATGRPSYTLDGWMCGREAVLACVARHAADADLVVVEGMMGCFDGLDGATEAGSTAEVAKWLGAPVVLVVDAGALARSAGAVVLGFARYDPALRLAGVVWNRVGGRAHARALAEALGPAVRVEVLGALGHDPALALPERHLGLVTAAEGPLTAEGLARLADAVERGVAVDRLLALAAELDPRHAGDAEAEEAGSARSRSGWGSEATGPAPARRVRIGVARDLAFQFYYAENLERLGAAGAELVSWSPLADVELPAVDGLYLGGGYPELHAARLAANAPLRAAVRRFAAAGRPVYAECGGLMYLGETLTDAAGVAHPMAGVLPLSVSLCPPRPQLGYTEVVFTADTPLGAAGTVARGHEFHHSTLGPVPASLPRAWQARQGAPVEGFLVGATLASYAHLHFASNPALAPAFVAACAGARV